MKEKPEKQVEIIDVGDLIDVGKSHSIKNFYISSQSLKYKFFREGFTFVFNGFSVGLCLAGHCRMRISGRNYDIVAGSLMILSPNQLTEIVSVSEDFQQRSIIVSLDVILEFPSPVDLNIMNSALKYPVIPLQDHKAEHLSEYYDFLEKQYEETENSYREEISKTLLYALMLEICDIFRSVSGEIGEVARPKPEKLTDDFLLLLTKYYRTEHEVAFYADRLNRTPKYLSSAIKRLSGRSVSDWISSTLISEIKLLLKVTDKTVLEISEDLNFSSPSVFVQFFRRNTGITPLQYRKQQ
ncbi:MAG: AraC family transcriptional regulator [Bacteroidetes bacterium]|uniref:AraC family transcriptional regulator n=1 Tax=Candidatus Cryptobacteroides intestinigallinarum TaxID=2840767 RepID=A0A9D9HLW3_9BACT|nr:AraC family transcriptional regulator [Candidatus Cryptobacteroides intestinigallinarum]